MQPRMNAHPDLTNTTRMTLDMTAPTKAGGTKAPGQAPCCPTSRPSRNHQGSRTESREIPGYARNQSPSATLQWPSENRLAQNREWKQPSLKAYTTNGRSQIEIRRLNRQG